MNAEQREQAILRNMQALKITRAEAEELVADDEAVDRGEPLPWDLNAEQIKNQRKLANANTRKSSGTVKRTKKENHDKQELITCAKDAFSILPGVSNLTCTNAERTIDFVYNDINYTLTLTAHRK